MDIKAQIREEAEKRCSDPDLTGNPFIYGKRAGFIEGAEWMLSQSSELKKENEAKDKEIERLKGLLFNDGLQGWLIKNRWILHSSKGYYYRSKDFHQWPPDETLELYEAEQQFKTENNL